MNRFSYFLPLLAILISGGEIFRLLSGGQTEAMDQKLVSQLQSPQGQDPNPSYLALAQHLPGWSPELCCPHSGEVVPSPGRTGSAVRFTLFRSDPDVATSRRAELRLQPVPPNSSYTYRFSVFLPDSYVSDRSFEIVSQWHNVPDTDLQESWRSPPLALLTQGGGWKLHRRWDPNPVTLNNQPGQGGGTETIDLGRYQPNSWTNWRINVRWSHQSDGWLEVWQNERRIYHHRGPNRYNDVQGPYLKIGLYKPDWKYHPLRSQLNQRVIYFDAISVKPYSDNPISKF